MKEKANIGRVIKGKYIKQYKMVVYRQTCAPTINAHASPQQARPAKNVKRTIFTLLKQRNPKKIKKVKKGLPDQILIDEDKIYSKE